MIAALIGLVMVQAPKQVILVGESLTRVAPKLATYLGHGYRVRTVSNARQINAKMRPTMVVLMPRLASNWQATRNHFVPDLENSVAQLRALPSHPSVLIATPLPVSPNSPQAKVISYELEPLTRQAGRESGTPIFDTAALFEGSADLIPSGTPSADGVGLIADQLAQTLDPVAVKADWRIIEFSSEAQGEGPASAAIDGNPATYWHTQYEPKVVKPPHWVTIDFGKPLRLMGTTYLPRQDGGTNGIVKGYEIYIGDSISDFGAPIATGDLPRGTNLKIIRWPSPGVGRFMKFVIASEQSGGPYGSAAEIGVLRLPD